MSGTKVLWGQIIVVMGLALAGVWLATEWTAWQLGYQAGLGPPWFWLAGHPIYPPPAFFFWWFVYDAYAPSVFVRGAFIAAAGALIAVLVAIAMSVWRAREAGKVTTYGSARWARTRDVKAAGMLGDAGVILGRFGRRYLRHNGPEHVLCFAPTRSGKGVGLVVPTLLTWPGSVIVHDIKGENWDLTAGFRATFGEVLRFDPTQVSSSAYNPLMEVRRGPTEVRDVQNIADMLVDPEGALERRSHWDKTSHSLLVGVILHVLYAESDKTLAGVANFLANPRRSIETTLRVMMRTPHLGDRPHPVVASAARELLNKSDNERSGVLSTAMSFLGLYRDPVVAAVTSRCDWRIADLVDGTRPVSLYLVVPPSDISRTKPLIRLILNQIGRRLTEELDEAQSRQELLWMLDEFRALGRLDFFEQALAFMAGYRMRGFLIAQSLNQIEGAYGTNNSILDNCHVRVAFSTNDERTARRISESLGTATELRAMKNYAGNRLSPWLGHLMVSRQETARPLLTQGEVMQLPQDQALVLASGAPPIRARKARYFMDRQLAARILSAPESPGRTSTKDAPPWTTIMAETPPPVGAAAGREDDEGGHQIAPELAMPPARPEPVPGTTPSGEDQDVDDLSVAADLQQRFRVAARQVALDPDDGIAL